MAASIGGFPFSATAAVTSFFFQNFVPYRLQTNKKCYLCR